MSGKITAQVLADTIRSYLEPVNQPLITLDKNIQTSITGLNGRLDCFEASWNQQLKDLESRQTRQFTEKITVLEKQVASLESKANDPSVAVAKELSLQEEKKSNIILFRLPEATSDEDKSTVSAILQSIDASPMTFNCYRVGKNASPTAPATRSGSNMPSRPIVVQFKFESEKVTALEGAAKLRHSLSFKDALIRPALTKAQRELNKLSEAALKAEAYQRNAALSNTEKDLFH
jgi:hypothetical protein